MIDNYKPFTFLQQFFFMTCCGMMCEDVSRKLLQKCTVPVLRLRNIHGESWSHLLSLDLTSVLTRLCILIAFSLLVCLCESQVMNDVIQHVGRRGPWLSQFEAQKCEMMDSCCSRRE